MPSLTTLNQLPSGDAESELLKCCGSRAWAIAMTECRPFADQATLLEEADRIWAELAREDWLEAFSHHPRIGEKQLREKFAATAGWATQEQQGTQGASEKTLTELARGNLEYEQRFGYVFLVCATGKAADEMLQLLQTRIHHDPAAELGIAAAEQAKITRIRLEKWLNS